MKKCSVNTCEKKVHSHGMCAAHNHRMQRHGDPLGGGVAWGAPMQWLKDAFAIDTDECQIFPYEISSRGYGRVYIDGKGHQANRIICTWEHGEPPTPQHEAAHSCVRTRACCNKRHLSWKTSKENSADMVGHATIQRGEINKRHILTEVEVLEIRAAKSTGTRTVVLSERYGVSNQTIVDIAARRRWGWLK